MSLSGSCEVTCDGETLTVQGRPDVFSGPSDFVYVPRDAAVVITSPAGGRFALPSAVCERPAALPPPAGRPGAGRAARGRRGEPPGQQLLHARRLRGRRADRLRGADARRQLVVVPAPQARRGDRDRERARGDLLLRGRRRPRRPGHRLPARLRPPGQGDRRPGRGAQRRRRADPVRLARPVDRGARLRPVLPQRDGRPRRRARLADLRRPRPRLGARHLGRPGGRPAAPVRQPEGEAR